ncbi:MAG: FAD-dependent oxidoreductase [Bradyrhizobiaceae bacterium]|nr:FAD-dependent oxidoreductase [Bradyrhizobiaceae bacterium]
MASKTINTRCCIVGGGPAGMMLGFLLARAGIDVVVLEKHADFLRDFRGDTMHPSTLELMHELGLLAEFLKLPHQRLPTLSARVGGTEVQAVDFSHLPVHCRFVAMMPQWDFLDFLADHARRYASFRLEMRAEALDLIEEDGVIVGVTGRTPEGTIDVRAHLTVGCDGRHSTVRDRARLRVEELGAPMDVLWFRIRRQPEDPADSALVLSPGHVFVCINRGKYWQCAYIIPKGTADHVRQGGLVQFRESVARILPIFHDRVQEITDWDAVKLLTVRVDRLLQWYRRGLLCIGDAAHAMSPVGGVGINLAVQDAVAAANLLYQPLLSGRVGEDDLRGVQQRREFPAWLTQRAQVFIQNRVIAGVLGKPDALKPPLALKMLQHVPFLRRIPARLLGMGLRPEHIATPDVMAAPANPSAL